MKNFNEKFKNWIERHPVKADFKDKKYNKISNTDPQAIIEQLYENFFSGNLPGVISLLSPDFVINHIGPKSLTPFYNTFYGVNGFLTWANSIITTGYLTNYEVKYYVTEEEKVNVHIIESGITMKNSQPTDVLYDIQNFHSFIVINGKIKEATIISESSTVIEAFTKGNPGDHYKSAYETSDYEIQENLKIQRMKKYSIKAIRNIICGNFNEIERMISDDTEFLLTGDSLKNNEIIKSPVPFFGKYTGPGQINDFIDKISEEITTFNFISFTGQKNKMDVLINAKGMSSTLIDISDSPNPMNKNFNSVFNFSFQFSMDYKIAQLSIVSNDYEIAVGYMPTFAFRDVTNL